MGYQPASREKIVETLNGLIRLDFDAVEAYEAAISRLKNSHDRDQLRRFRMDHERHTQELTGAVRGLAGEPATSADVMRFLAKGKVVLGGLLNDDAVLQAMRSNEETTNDQYEHALELQGLPPNVRALLERNLSDERRHRAWLEQRLEAGRVSHAP